MNKLERDTIDAALHLLDRQVIDADGRMVCNVDDLEVTDDGTGSLAVTGLLTGGAALFPRFSGLAGAWLTRTWHRLGYEYAGRDVPRWLPLGLVSGLGSAIELRVGGEGLLDRQPPPAPGNVSRRISHLLGMTVRSRDGVELGRVLDVRLAPLAESYPVRQLVVGRGRPGSLLGYDRGTVSGPWMLDRLVSWLHRHTGELPWERVARVDWSSGEVQVDGGLDPLTGS